MPWLNILQWMTKTDVLPIGGIFEVPGALPMVGHLPQLGDDHATRFESFWKRYSHSTFQVRLGNTRAVVVNSFGDNKAMLVGNQSAVIDRPTLYTFHGVISSTQGFTIGTSPWDESCKKRRRAAGAALSRPAMKRYFDMFDLEAFGLLSDIYRDSQKGSHELDVHPYNQKLALNTNLTLCYGVRMDNVQDDMLREILEVGSAISRLRSTSENYQDYVPILRYLPSSKTEKSKSLRKRRDRYLDLLLGKTRAMIEAGIDKPCIASALIRDEETILTNMEVSSVCLSLVSGGFETIPATLTSCIGSLSTVEGQKFQDRAYEDIKRHYPNMQEMWRESFREESVPYVNAIVKEATRYYTAQAMSLPRKTVSEIRWGDAVIPPKTMILINAQAANHDKGYWGADADVFNPERWLLLDPETQWPQEISTEGLQHLSFGAGSRACSGLRVAVRVLYTALVRLISSFRVEASETAPPTTDYVDYNRIKSGLVAQPREFKVRLVPRDVAGLEVCLDEGRERTKNYYTD